MFKTNKVFVPFILGIVVFFAQCESKSLEKTPKILSPDGTIEVILNLSDDNKLTYQISKNNTLLLEPSRLGIIRKDGDFSKNLKLTSSGQTKEITDEYTLKTGKKKNIKYQANQQVFNFENNKGQKIDIIFQVSNTSVAFRYYFPEKTDSVKFVEQELTSFNFADNALAWMQPCADAKTSWGRCNPSYEENYKMEIPVSTDSPFKAGWVFPALFKTGTNWVIVSETGLENNYCATRLKQKSPNGEYSIGFPQAAEVSHTGELNPESKLPWYTPWRVMAIGSLKTVTESTVGTDLAVPEIDGNFHWVKPGKASWSWVLLKDDKTIYPVQKEFIDYASEMNWQYCLVDAQWDQQIGYDNIKKLADYARTKNVELILWYNSSGDWNDTHQTPKNMMRTQESRIKEFTKIKEMGIRAVKIDFFGGDGQSVIKYYHDILNDAAKIGIMVNFHGCTLPRGWQRTYPNLLTMESVKGFEYATFEQKDCDVLAPHCVMQPFTRNVFDPMDFTPVCFSEIPNIKRYTSNAFELALSVLFVSGIQHYAEIPEGMKATPSYVQEAMKNIPSTWDDSRYVDGYPGKYVVMARRNKDRWYIAGINAQKNKQEVSLDLSFANGYKGIIITDGKDNRSFNSEEVKITDNNLELSIEHNGGFLIQLSK